MCVVHGHVLALAFVYLEKLGLVDEALLQNLEAVLRRDADRTKMAIY